jgi:hypothetical protein
VINKDNADLSVPEDKIVYIEIDLCSRHKNVLMTSILDIELNINLGHDKRATGYASL